MQVSICSYSYVFRWLFLALLAVALPGCGRTGPAASPPATLFVPPATETPAPAWTEVPPATATQSTTVTPPSPGTASPPATMITPTITTAVEVTSPLSSPPIDVGALTGRIVFSAEGDVYVMDADGSNRTQLTTNPAWDFDPVWSPDGTRIAFRSHRDGDAEIYVMNADGTGQTNLTNYPGNDDWSPAWSSDGLHIAFASIRPDGAGIWVIGADGSDPHPVATPPGVNDYPAWSTDSQKIAWNCTFDRFLYGRVADFEICVVNADGSGLVQLTDSAGNNKFPAWSPDGEHIAFTSDRLGWPTLPDYTPPGYDPDNYGDMELYLMNADGSGQTNLTNHPRADDEFPAWSRDGYLLFTRYGCLMVINADGSGLAPVATCQEGGHFPDWHQPPAAAEN